MARMIELLSGTARQSLAVFFLFILAALGSIANAATSCPAGQVLQYRVQNNNQNGLAPCEVGAVSGSLSALVAQCDKQDGNWGRCTAVPLLTGGVWRVYDHNPVPPASCTAIPGQTGGFPIATIVGDCIVVQPPTCEVDKTYPSFKVAPPGSTWAYQPSPMCHNGCRYTAQLVRLEKMQSTIFLDYKQTGQGCEAQEHPTEDAEDEPVPVTDPEINTEPGVCLDGTTTCMRRTERNCGIVNGERRCLGDDLPDGGCVTTASGGMFCTESAPNKPDNGTAGQPATPDSSFQGVRNGALGANTGTVNYYNSSTVQASTNHGDGETPEEPGGECDPETEDCSKCGAPGQPACRVKVDETGTPTAKPDYWGEHASGIDGGLSAISEAITSKNPSTGDGVSASDLINETGIGVLAAGSCPTVIAGSFMGVEFTFPDSVMCSMLEKWRAAFGWVLFALAMGRAIAEAVEAM